MMFINDDVWFFVKLLDNKAVIGTNSPDFFHFSINGLEQLVDTYGLASPQFTDALALLKTVSQHVRYERFFQYLNGVNLNIENGKQNRIYCDPGECTVPEQLEKKSWELPPHAKCPLNWCICVSAAPRGAWYPLSFLFSPLSIHFLIFCSCLLFPLFVSYLLYLFSSFVHPFPFYQNSPIPFPGRRS